MNSVITAGRPALAGVWSNAELLRAPDNSARHDPAAVLGKKGLRYKDSATRLALAAAQLTLHDGGLLDADGQASYPTMVVVVSSNFGNVDTTFRTAANVIASDVAVCFGLFGPTLLLRNGATSGVDALRWADLSVRSGRTSRILVIGVEPYDAMARSLSGPAKVIGGGAAVVVESAATAGRRAKARLLRIVRAPNAWDCLREMNASDGIAAGLWLSAESFSTKGYGVRTEDLGARFGSASGAPGVLQCAAGLGWFEQGGNGRVQALCGTGGAHQDADGASAGFVLAPASIRCRSR